MCVSLTVVLRLRPNAPLYVWYMGQASCLHQERQREGERCVQAPAVLSGCVMLLSRGQMRPVQSCSGQKNRGIGEQGLNIWRPTAPGISKMFRGVTQTLRQAI